MENAEIQNFKCDILGDFHTIFIGVRKYLGTA